MFANWSRMLLLAVALAACGRPTDAITLEPRGTSGTTVFKTIDCESPAALDFGAVARGDSFPISLSLHNTATAPMTAFIGDITSAAGDDKFFTFASKALPGQLPLKAGEEKTFTIAFAPTELRDSVAWFALQRADVCPVSTIKLIGTGVDICLTWAPNPLQFGTVAPGNVATAQLAFSNLCLTPVSLSGFSASAAAYTTTASEPLIVPPGTRDAAGVLVPGSAIVTLQFSPNGAGPRFGWLDFDTSLSRMPHARELLTASQ